MDKGFDEIVMKEKERSLHISRVPKNTKEAFVELADEEFAGDYGMCLKSIFDNFALWKLLFENIDMKLDNILERFSQLEQEEKKPEKEFIRTLDGKNRVKGGIK